MKYFLPRPKFGALFALSFSHRHSNRIRLFLAQDRNKLSYGRVQVRHSHWIPPILWCFSSLEAMCITITVSERSYNNLITRSHLLVIYHIRQMCARTTHTHTHIETHAHINRAGWIGFQFVFKSMEKEEEEGEEPTTSRAIARHKHVVSSKMRANEKTTISKLK